MMQWTASASRALFLYTGLSSFLFGVMLALLGVSALHLVFAALGFACVLMLLVFLGYLHRRSVVVVFGLAACALGLLRVEVSKDPMEVFAPFSGKEVTVRGMVVSDPERRGNALRAIIKTETIQGEPHVGRMFASFDRAEDLSYGEYVELRGAIELPEVFVTDSGNEFDYPNYLRAKHIGAVMYKPQLRIIEESNTSIFGLLFVLKEKLELSMERVLPEPSAGLLQGMLLGNKDALPESISDAFKTVGLVHIVVLSGYNLTLVSDVFMRVSSMVLPRLPSLLVGASGIVLFASMVGAEATVLRASIMALLVVVAKALNRPHAIMRALCFAGFVMVVHQPYILVFDPSFILSFLATFGLVTLSPVVEKKITFVTDRFGVRGIVAATLATQIFVLPALMYYSGMFSVLSLPANLIALPLVPYAMFFGFLAAALGWVGYVFAVPLLVPAWVLLSAIVEIAVQFSTIPFAEVSVGFIQSPLLFLSYIVLLPYGAYAFMRNSREEEVAAARYTERT